MKKLIASLVLGLGLVSYVSAETDYIALPILQDIQNGVSNGNCIVDLRVKDDAIIEDDMSVGGDLTVTGTSVGSGKITSYGYPVSLSTTSGTASAAVFMTQVGTVASTGNDAALTATNTFAVSFVATPTVMWRYHTAGIPATNDTTVASNAFTVAVCQTNGSYIAYGRVK
jgi:hypothetical protein